MSKIVIIELPRKRSTQDLFCGYIESKLRFKDGNPMLSRCHSQPKRIHSVLGGGSLRLRRGNTRKV